MYNKSYLVIGRVFYGVVRVCLSSDWRVGREGRLTPTSLIKLKPPTRSKGHIKIHRIRLYSNQVIRRFLNWQSESWVIWLIHRYQAKPGLVDTH